MIAAAMKITFEQIPCDPGQVGESVYSLPKSLKNVNSPAGASDASAGHFKAAW